MAALYRMELRKIWGRKITMFSAVLLLALTVTYLMILVSGERKIENGKPYSGIQAIEKNREMEELYNGTLDDQKLQDILKKTNPWDDQNYITDFIVQWLSDGTLEHDNSGGIYREPSRIYTIGETKLGRVMSESGKKITLGYNQGYQTFLDYIQSGMAFLSIFLIIALTPVFSEEYQEKTAGIIYVSEYGRTKGPGAKIAAAFTTAAGAFAVITGIGITVCRLLYGVGNWKMMTGILLGDLNKYLSMYQMEIGKFTVLYLMMALGGILMLVGIIVCLSAHLKKNYHVMIAVVAVWFLPILIRFLLGPGIWMVFGETQPIYQIMYQTMIDAESTRGLQIVMIAAGIFGGSVMGYKRSARMEK